MVHFGKDNDPVQIDAAHTRADTIRAQLQLAVSFCNLVPTELEYGHADQAHSLIEKAQHVAETVSKHIGEESHVPSEELPQLKERLRNLEILIADTQRKLAA